jgi:hypothetical protein
MQAEVRHSVSCSSGFVGPQVADTEILVGDFCLVTTCDAANGHHFVFASDSFISVPPWGCAVAEADRQPS